MVWNIAHSRLWIDALPDLFSYSQHVLRRMFDGIRIVNAGPLGWPPCARLRQGCPQPNATRPDRVGAIATKRAERETGVPIWADAGFSQRKRRNEEVKRLLASRGRIFCSTYRIVVQSKILRVLSTNFQILSISLWFNGLLCTGPILPISCRANSDL